MRHLIKLNIDTSPAKLPYIMMAIDDIVEERRRQIDPARLNYTAEHDASENRHGELALAALSYASFALTGNREAATWPWNEKAWHPEHTERNLVKAGALCLAEVVRCDRAGIELTDGTDELHHLIIQSLADLYGQTRGKVRGRFEEKKAEPAETKNKIDPDRPYWQGGPGSPLFEAVVQFAKDELDASEATAVAKGHRFMAGWLSPEKLAEHHSRVLTRDRPKEAHVPGAIRELIRRAGGHAVDEALGGAHT